MNKQQTTQADLLKNQFRSKNSGLTKEVLTNTLKELKYHGRKIDVPLDWIKTGENLRFELEEIDALKKQIVEIGLAQPIGIQLLDGQITLVYGHRRFQAYKELDKEYPKIYSAISCIAQVYRNPEEGRVIAQAVENLGRAQLKPLDECRAIAELKAVLKAKDGSVYSNSDLGEFLGGVHRKTIDLAIVIAGWPQKIQMMIRKSEDRFSISVLRAIAKRGLKGALLEKQIRQIAQAREVTVRKEKAEVSLKGKEIRSYTSYLNELDIADDLRLTLLKQKSWLGSQKAREVMAFVLQDYFKA